MRYGVKTCSSCRNILMLLFTEGSERLIFIRGETREFTKPPSTSPRKDSNDDIYIYIYLFIACVCVQQAFGRTDNMPGVVRIIGESGKPKGTPWYM